MCICTGDCSVHMHRCNEGASSYAVCGMNATMAGVDSATDTSNVTLLIPGTDILEQLDVTLPLYATYLVMVAIGVVFRILAYFALRFLHRKHQ